MPHARSFVPFAALALAAPLAHAEWPEAPPPTVHVTSSVGPTSNSGVRVDIHVEVQPPATVAPSIGTAPAPVAQPLPPVVWLPPPMLLAPPPPRRVAYSGGPIPEGAVLVTHRNPALIAVGTSMFAGAWLVSTIDALVCSSDPTCSEQAAMVLPIVGPLIALGSSRIDSGSRAALGVDSFLQIAGLLMLAVGAAPRRELVFDHPEGQRAPWTVTPFAQRGSAGLSLATTF